MKVIHEFIVRSNPVPIRRITIAELLPGERNAIMSNFKIAVLVADQTIRYVVLPNWPLWVRRVVSIMCVPIILPGFFFRKQRVFVVLLSGETRPITVFSVSNMGEIGNLAIQNKRLLFRLMLEYRLEIRKVLQKCSSHLPDGIELYAVVRHATPIAKLISHVGFIHSSPGMGRSRYILSRHRIISPLRLLVWNCIFNWAQVWWFPRERANYNCSNKITPSASRVNLSESKPASVCSNYDGAVFCSAVPS